MKLWKKTFDSIRKHDLLTLVALLFALLSPLPFDIMFRGGRSISVPTWRRKLYIRKKYSSKSDGVNSMSDSVIQSFVWIFRDLIST